MVRSPTAVVDKEGYVKDWLCEWVFNMTPPRSEVWKQFIRIDKSSAKCKSCGAVVKTSGNTVNLWNHMKRRHEHQTERECEPAKRRRSVTDGGSSTSGDRSLEDQIPDDPNKVCDEECQSLPCTSSSTCSTSAENSTSTPGNSKKRVTSVNQPTLAESFGKLRSFGESGHMTSSLNEALMYMVTKDKLSLDFVEGSGFLYFAKKAVPWYKVPSRRTFTRMLDEKYDVLSARMKSTLSEVKSFTLTADIWTDKYTTQSYLGTTVHFLSGTEMKNATIGIKPLSHAHDAIYIEEMFQQTCDEWSIDIPKVNLAVTDNAQNIVSAAKKLFGPSKHIGCFAHTLNLVTERAIEDTPGLKDLIDKVKSIVTVFKQNVNAADQLKDIQLKNGTSEGNLLKLKQAVPTRWNSIYLMIVRFIELCDVLGAVLLKHRNVVMLNGDELSALKEVCRVLKPFYHATVELSGEKYTSVSTVIPMMNRMKQLLSTMECSDDTDAPLSFALKDKLISQIDRRFGQVESVETFAIATVLDPRFKKIHFRDITACSRAIKKISTKVMELQQEKVITTLAVDSRSDVPSDQDSVWSLHDALVASSVQEPDNPGGIPAQLRMYLNTPVASRNSNPLELWEQCKTVYPQLYEIARDYLGRVALSVPCERLFSKAGATATDRRSRLTGKRLSKLIFLSSLNEAEFF